MGNYRFRLSDMIPNAWFYKLKDMSKSKSRKQYSSHPFKKKPHTSTTASQKSSISQPRYSYFFTEPGKIEKFYNSPIGTETPDSLFPNPTRQSSKKISRRKAIYKPSPKLDSTNFISLRSPDYSESPFDSSSKSDFHEYPLSESEEDDSFYAPESCDHQVASYLSSCNCKVSSSINDIVIDVNRGSFERRINKVVEFDQISELDLPPILTKPAKFNNGMNEFTKFKRNSSTFEEINAQKSLFVRIAKEDSFRTRNKERKAKHLTRKSSSNSAGIRLRSNTPRIASRKIQACARKSISSSSSRNKNLLESLAVVKCSVDPLRDFRDSMVEMIVEHNIRASKDLEELLACYLSLNSNEYHDLIVKAFEQIWFAMTDLSL